MLARVCSQDYIQKDGVQDSIITTYTNISIVEQEILLLQLFRHLHNHLIYNAIKILLLIKNEIAIN